MTNNTHIKLDDIAIDWGRIETWCSIASGQKICGPVLKRIEETGRALEAERDGLLEQLEALVLLVRVGFLVTVNGVRGSTDVINDPDLRKLLFTILQAPNTADAIKAVIYE